MSTTAHNGLSVHCDHDWQEREEIVGDNLVPNGGELTYSWVECTLCGAQKEIEPEPFDYDDDQY